MAKLYRVGRKRYTLEQMLANPRLRSHLPDSKLPAHLLAMRKENTRRKKAAGPGAEITVGAVEDILKNQFGGYESQLKQRQAEIPGWYDQFRAQLGALQEQQTQAIGRMPGEAQTMMASMKDNSGPGVGNDPQAAARQQAAEGVRQNLMGSWASARQSVAQNQQGLLNNQMNASYGMQSNAQGELQRLFTDLASKKKSAYDDIVDKDRQSQIEAAAFGLKRKDTLADNERQDAAETWKKRYQQALLDQGYRRIKNAAKKRGSKGVSDSKARTNNDNWTTAVRASRAILDRRNKQKKPINDIESLARAIRLYDSSVSMGYARMAAERALNGGKVSSGAKDRLASDGVRY